MDLDNATLEELRAKAAELKQRLSTSRDQPIPSTSTLLPFQPNSGQNSSSIPSDASLQPPPTSALDDVQELARKYRITGRSCFPVELARGARAKEEIKEVERERKKRRKGKERAIEDDEREEGEEEEMVRKGVAVRLETFYAGRYYEPYYIVFAHHLPDLDAPNPPNPQLYIPHHTVPHWIPLSRLTWRYLGVRLQSDDADPAELAGDEKGGEADLELFLSLLQAYLNAFVSRREQLVSLRTAFSPDLSSPSPLNFRLFATEPCDRIMIEWNISSARERAKRDDEDDDEEEEEEAEKMVKSVVVQVAFHDLRVERFEQIDGEEGASLLVRYSEKQPGVYSPDQTILTTLAEEAVGGPGEGKTMDEVVRWLVAETTREGWEPVE